MRTTAFPLHPVMRLAPLLLCAVLAQTVGRAHAAGEAELWDGVYLQTQSGKNIEVPVTVFNFTRKRTPENTSVSCVYEAMTPERYTLIKGVRARDIQTAFAKPAPKYLAQLHELRLLTVGKVRADEPDQRYCTDSSWQDFFPTGRKAFGGYQLKVAPALKPNVYYLMTVNNGSDRIIRFDR